MHSTDPITRLIRELARLPGIGQKTATRLAFHILRSPAPQARELAQALIEVKEKIRLCSQCMNLTEQDPCALCADPSRDGRVVCVVAHPPDLLAIERTSTFRGRYHVLHGVLSPLDGVGPDDLKLRELLLRVQGITPGGAAAHPDWYRNLVAHPEVIVEVGAERFNARADTAQGEERERLFNQHAAAMPYFRGFQEKTQREIPVIILARIR